MMKAKIAPIFCFLSLFALSLAEANPQLAGKWKIDRDLSTAFDPWRSIELEIEVDGSRVTIEELHTTGRRRSAQVYELDLGKPSNVVPVSLWTGNRHIGAYIGGDGTMRVDADLVDEGRTLALECHYVLDTSQGSTPVRSHKEFRPSADGDQLIVMELRSSRPRPVLYVFNREN